MQAAVWDTYVKKKDGNVMHFDIIVPDSIKDEQVIYGYGKAYLVKNGEAESRLNIEECRFCHIEEPTTEMKEAINTKGYYILEMDEIPAALSPNPSRRDLIFYIRAHYKEHRFANFQGKTTEDIQNLLT
jgi:hypothetical protein